MLRFIKLNQKLAPNVNFNLMFYYFKLIKVGYMVENNLIY